MVIQATPYGKSSTARLPKEYQEVEYIQSSGTQYIDTGFNPNQDTRTVMICEIVSGSVCYVFGTWLEYPQSMYSAYWVNYWGADYASSRTEYTEETSQAVTIDMNKNVITVGSTTKTVTKTTFTAPAPLTLFALNNSSNANPGQPDYFAIAKLYRCKMYDNGTLIRDFVPCYQKAYGAIGLYDIVNGVFYGNAGTGTFTKGADVSGGSSGEPFAFTYSGDFTDSRVDDIGDVTLNTSGQLVTTGKTVKVKAYILAAGGGAARSTYSSFQYGGASGGGGGNQIVEVELVPGTYEIVIGTGGNAASGSYGTAVTGGTGGDTTAFGVTSTGGRGGSVDKNITVITGGTGGTPNGGTGSGGSNYSASAVTYAGGSPNGGGVTNAVASAGGDGYVKLTFI